MRDRGLGQRREQDAVGEVAERERTGQIGEGRRERRADRVEIGGTHRVTRLLAPIRAHGLQTLQRKSLGVTETRHVAECVQRLDGEDTVDEDVKAGRARSPEAREQAIKSARDPRNSVVVSRVGSIQRDLDRVEPGEDETVEEVAVPEPRSWRQNANTIITEGDSLTDERGKVVAGEDVLSAKPQLREARTTTLHGLPSPGDSAADSAHTDALAEERGEAVVARPPISTEHAGLLAGARQLQVEHVWGGQREQGIAHNAAGSSIIESAADTAERSDGGWRQSGEKHEMLAGRPLSGSRAT